MQFIDGSYMQKFKVRCMRDIRGTYDMSIRIFRLSDSVDFVRECAGCENYNGSEQCEKCRAIVTLMFRNGYKAYGDEILVPDLTLLPLDTE